MDAGNEDQRSGLCRGLSSGMMECKLNSCTLFIIESSSKCGFSISHYNKSSGGHRRIRSTVVVNQTGNKNSNRDSLYIDKRGKMRSFNDKKLSRKKGGTLRGRGWKYGTGFVDGVFPVISPTGQQLLNLLLEKEDIKEEDHVNMIWGSLDALPPSHTTWDDLINVVVQLRLNKQWDPIITVCKWILYRSSFQPDVMCYNLLIDSYGQKSLYKKAESIYLELLEARIVPNEDTYAVLLKAYCTSGLLDKAEAIFSEMQNNGLPPSMPSSNYLHVMWIAKKIFSNVLQILLLKGQENLLALKRNPLIERELSNTRTRIALCSVFYNPATRVAACYPGPRLKKTSVV